MDNRTRSTANLNTTLTTAVGQKTYRLIPQMSHPTRS